MARKRQQRGRPVNGILLLDKGIGMTSNAALQSVKNLFKARKAGHTGSLDTLASGMLPICFGEATKLSAFLLDAEKVYLGTCKLGIKTSTGDAEGEVIDSRPVPKLDESQVKKVLEDFTGEIEQIPPMHSAIKQDGKRLYKLAHQGIVVERQPRKVTIHELRLERLQDDELDIYVHCSKGTYIRTLAEDIGEALGCGAHLSALHRIGVGPFQEADMVNDSQLQVAAQEGLEALDGLLLPMEEALTHWPAIYLTADSAFYIKQGQAVLVPQAPTTGLVRLFDAGKSFIGVGILQDDGKIAPKRLLNTG